MGVEALEHKQKVHKGFHLKEEEEEEAVWI
jgi:hypothetical protein